MFCLFLGNEAEFSANEQPTAVGYNAAATVQRLSLIHIYRDKKRNKVKC